ncbi:MAG TPA: methyltransferase domain-containing protein [Paludibacteraceae bacterium]|nr:methyltransferase domain-containing protein [Paludibacteraceae bacterium]HOS36742.1 methyltransferase domain-containing protein [Paludibacteraceae bacterium]
MENKVSEYDEVVYQKIRTNVTAFIKQQAANFDSELIKLLDIAPQVHAGARQFFTKAHIFTADIDEKSGADYIIDICQNNEKVVPEATFDIIVCTEVLKHTLNPFQAVREIYRLLKPEGLLLMSTPFDFRIHGPLPDCWRFTEHGIRSLLNDFKTIKIEALENENRFLMPYHYTTVAKK